MLQSVAWVAVASVGVGLLVMVTSLIRHDRLSFREVAPFLSAASFCVVGVGLVCFGVSGLRRALVGGAQWPMGNAALAGAWITAALFVVGAVAVSLPRRHVTPRSPPTFENVKNLTTLLIDAEIRRGWPPHSGKNFILALVASGAIDAQNPDNLPVFFPHADPARTPDASLYAEVTPESLGTRRFPDLTAYAGRRNADPRYRLPTGEAGELLDDPPEPLVADVSSWADHAIVGFSNGSVRALDRKALGLDETDPIVVGDASRSPVLRPLSLD